MNRPPPSALSRLVSHYWHGDALRSRGVSDVVAHGTLALPALPPRLLADWDREVVSQLHLAPGDVEALSLPRARMRWPDYRLCVEAVAGWARGLGLHEVLAAGDVALMACRGARYHHDGAQYGGAAFLNVFISDDKGLDLHFPGVGLRIPLVRGTVVVFDTGQTHAVIARGASGFDVAHFMPERDDTQVFLTWELPIEDADVVRALGIDFDVDPATTSQLQEEQVCLNGGRVSVCPASGRWCAEMEIQDF